MFFSSKRRKQESTRKDAEIDAIRQGIFKKADQATKSTDKLRKLLENSDDITLKIFYATGGDRRRTR